MQEYQMIQSIIMHDYLIFLFKYFEAKRLCSEMVIEVELNCSIFTSLYNPNQGDLGL